MHHVVNAPFPDILPRGPECRCTSDCRKKYRYMGLIDKAPRPIVAARRRLCGGASIVSPIESDDLAHLFLTMKRSTQSRATPESIRSATTKGSFCVVDIWL